MAAEEDEDEDGDGGEEEKRHDDEEEEEPEEDLIFVLLGGVQPKIESERSLLRGGREWKKSSDKLTFFFPYIFQGGSRKRERQLALFYFSLNDLHRGESF